jgi:hypothetical protein
MTTDFSEIPLPLSSSFDMAFISKLLVLDTPGTVWGSGIGVGSLTG